MCTCVKERERKEILWLEGTLSVVEIVGDFAKAIIVSPRLRHSQKCCRSIATC